jgi:hypothetical protein
MRRAGGDWIDALFAATVLLALGAVAFAEGNTAKVSSNETAAIATLRNLAACQAALQSIGKVDGDGDGIGEYGTFLELTGSVGTRKGLAAPKGKKGDPDFTLLGSTFKKLGTVVSPAIMSPALANVDKGGFVTKVGYAFTIFLPDTAIPAGFVHETGPAAEVGLAGGTGSVGIDLSETTWCAYAQPVVRGETGNRRFFVNQAGDVMQSSNDVRKAQGVTEAIQGNSAFTGAGITSRVAVGTVGKDGDVWKVAN